MRGRAWGVWICLALIFNVSVKKSLLLSISSDEKKHLSEDAIDDFFEYTRGKKIPPEGIPGFDFSDPESIVEFTK